MTTTAGAQNLMLSGAIQRAIQRFPEGDVPSRLDGSAAGFVVGAGARWRNHLAFAVEWSDAGTIEDARTTALDINGRTVAITSTFWHHTSTAAALGGYSHMLSSRVRVAYLGGVASTQVTRKFASNAPGLVLVGPSDPSSSSLSSLFDRFWGMTGGVDAFVQIRRRLHAVAGFRTQRITLHPATQSPRRRGPDLHPTAQSPRGGGPGLHPTAQSPRGGGPGLHPTAQSPRGGGPGLPPGDSGWSVRTFVGAGWGL